MSAICRNRRTVQVGFKTRRDPEVVNNVWKFRKAAKNFMSDWFRGKIFDARDKHAIQGTYNKGLPIEPQVLMPVIQPKDQERGPGVPTDASTTPVTSEEPSQDDVTPQVGPISPQNSLSRLEGGFEPAKASGFKPTVKPSQADFSPPDWFNPPGGMKEFQLPGQNLDDKERGDNFHFDGGGDIRKKRRKEGLDFDIPGGGAYPTRIVNGFGPYSKKHGYPYQHYSKKPGFAFNPVQKINEINKDQSLHGEDFGLGSFKPSNVHLHDHQYKYPGVDSFLKVGQKTPFTPHKHRYNGFLQEWNPRKVMNPKKSIGDDENVFDSGLSLALDVRFDEHGETP